MSMYDAISIYSHPAYSTINVDVRRYHDSRPISGTAPIVQLFNVAGFHLDFIAWPKDFGVETLHRLWIPDWMLLVATAYLPLRWLATRTLQERDAGCCPVCGYDVRATLDRCPECGTPAAIADGSRNC
jgi:hypothetical protein